jgi:serine/threonine protein kinase
VHRDVKTENMLLDKTRTVKIADFGVARVEASNPSDMTGETGTLGYMAPEVCLIFYHLFQLCDSKDDTYTPPSHMHTGALEHLLSTRLKLAVWDKPQMSKKFLLKCTLLA